jgi:hypothetical protein
MQPHMLFGPFRVLRSRHRNDAVLRLLPLRLGPMLAVSIGREQSGSEPGLLAAIDAAALVLGDIFLFLGSHVRRRIALSADRMDE